MGAVGGGKLDEACCKLTVNEHDALQEDPDIAMHKCMHST